MDLINVYSKIEGSHKLCEPFGIWYLVFGIWFLVTGISSQPILGLGSWREESLPWHCLESNGYAAWRP